MNRSREKTQGGPTGEIRSCVREVAENIHSNRKGPTWNTPTWTVQ